MFVSACIIILASLVLIFIILCKIYITLLMITGLSRSVARFQVFSAFTNSGFTSGESELVMYDKFRRKVCLASMITGYLFSTLVTALVVGVVAGLNFKDTEYTGIYWARILTVFGITAGILIIFLILTKVPVLRKWVYNILREIVTPDIIRKGNPIIYESIVFDKFIAQVELRQVRDTFKNYTIGQLDFAKAGITLLLVTKKDKSIFDTKSMSDVHLEEGDIIQVFGSAKDIEKIFSMK